RDFIEIIFLHFTEVYLQSLSSIRYFPFVYRHLFKIYFWRTIFLMVLIVIATNSDSFGYINAISQIDRLCKIHFKPVFKKMYVRYVKRRFAGKRNALDSPIS